MIQRKQSVFLLVAALLSIVAAQLQLATVENSGQTALRLFSLWAIDSAGARSFTPWPLFLLTILSAAISLCTIFLFKRRMLQSRLCTANVLICVLWYLALVVVSKQVAPDAMNFQLALPSALPALSACMLVLARRAIIADERLVRAADRIR